MKSFFEVALTVVISALTSVAVFAVWVGVFGDYRNDKPELIIDSGVVPVDVGGYSMDSFVIRKTNTGELQLVPFVKECYCANQYYTGIGDGGGKWLLEADGSITILPPDTMSKTMGVTYQDSIKAWRQALKIDTPIKANEVIKNSKHK